ncbi:unnamed protein product [Clonostachys rhizophaga]|uniref:FAD dependent oxidoreductase domain-containing protein n=1 Tax=Clonostachys rhizophaga TaxID=160324 RepID=A0A9N9VDD8_9HYPO|nr:unnamed protein product [Clonostachys rhizophaga]
MASSPLSKQDPVIIVGAGVFGLSTALHLAQRGYSAITVFDRLDYDNSEYSYLKGCDAASADINKIVRTGYGKETMYSDLSLEAIQEWHSWNAQIAAGDVPPGMEPNQVVFRPNGVLVINEGSNVPDFEMASIKSIADSGLAGTQFLSTLPGQEEAAKKKGFNMDPFQTRARGQQVVTLLDSAGGTAIADRACLFAAHKARSFGVKFVLGPQAGSLESVLYGPGGEAIGIQTKDGKQHRSRLTVLACGGWTPALLPELDGLCEATGGAVAVYRIPRSSPLWDRLSHKNFPAFNFRMRDGHVGGLYGFPRDDNGLFKIGYRGTKYTNPKTQPDGKTRSTPVTRYTESEKITAIPKQASEVLLKFVSEYLPELAQEGLGVDFTRMCWYTDTFDNHFVVDKVPNRDGLMVATGGSGHAFKYLPNIGKWVADVIEGIGLDRPAVQAWRWRSQGNESPANVLSEGPSSSRALHNVVLVKPESRGPDIRARL